jgi:hypothetical protein
MTVDLKPRFKLLKSPEDSELLNTTSLTREQIVCYCNRFSDNMSYFETAELSYYSWSLVCVKSQILIFEILGYCEYPDALDRIGDLLYSMIQPKLIAFLKHSADDFIESLLYPHREGSTLTGFKNIIGWLENCKDGLIFSKMEGEYPVTKGLLKELVKDCYSKQLSQELTEKSTRISLRKVNAQLSRENRNSPTLYRLLFVAKFQCFNFSSQPISSETVSAFLQSIQTCSFSFEKLIDSMNGASIFANCYLQPVMLQCDSIPVELIKMIHSAAFALCQSKDSADEEGVTVPRISALTRWFTPWFGLDFRGSWDNNTMTIQEKKGFFRSGKEFVSLFGRNLARKLKCWNLGERDSPVPCYEIDNFMSTIINLFSTTELDFDMIDLILRNNIAKLLDQSLFRILIFCLQSEIRKLFRVIIPEVSVPCEWVKKSENQKIFSGVDKAIYPWWRQQAMQTLLGLEKYKAETVIMSLLKDPIATEIEFVLDFFKGKSRPGILQELFRYLDKIFKFKPEKTWLQSELFRIIEKAIAGITAKSEKATAIFASTWKCETFEEYMRIVSLF